MIGYPYECPWCRVKFKTFARINKHEDHCKKRFESYRRWNINYNNR